MGILSAAKTELNAIVPGLPLGDILLGHVGEFKKGFVFEVVDSKTGEALLTKSLVLNPRRYTITEPFASTLTPTEDNTVVAEENGIIIREISIEGTTGLRTRAEEAFGRGGSIGTEASGPDHFYQLRDLFRQYSVLKQDPERSPYIQMLFHNVKEDDHFVVVPRAFETPRDAGTNRVHFNYRITLAAVQVLPPPSPPGENGLGELGDALKEITEAVNDGRAFMVEMIDLIDVYRERIRDPEAFLEQTALCINAAHDLIDSVSATIRVNREVYKTVSELLEFSQESMENDIDNPPSDFQLREARKFKKLRSTLERIQSHPEKFEPPLGEDLAKAFAGDRNLTEDDLVNGTAGADTGTRTRLAMGSEKNAGLGLGAFRGSRRIQLAITDTIEGVAAANGVPREAIIALNNLRFPYITKEGGPGTLRPGDNILIPTRTSGRRQGTVPKERYLTTEDILYGVDLALDPELASIGVFDIAVDELHGSIDAQFVRGKNNAAQGIQILIGTERGSTVYISDLGIKRLPGTKGTLNNMLLSSLYLREAILSDPRIRGIDSSSIVLRNDVLTQEISPVLIDERDGVTIVVPFGKAAQ